jgi:hypothetical protein
MHYGLKKVASPEAQRSREGALDRCVESVSLLFFFASANDIRGELFEFGWWQRFAALEPHARVRLLPVCR